MSQRQARMNTPWRKTPPAVVDEGKILRASEALQGALLGASDFEAAGNELCAPPCASGTLVYMDPPYWVRGKFVGYTPHGWGEADLVRLLTAAARWSAAGAHVVVSHADTPELRSHLARLWPDAVLHSVLARRAVNSDGAGRGPVAEVILTSCAMRVSATAPEGVSCV